jgi:ribosomal protein L11 methyltransferase
MEKAYVEVRIVSDEDLNEKLAGIMSQLGFEGFWEEGRTLRCYMSQERWTQAMLAEIDTVAKTVARASTSETPRLSVRTLPNQNWNEEWEKSIAPIHVTERIVITPSWHNYGASPDHIVITIDPKMSFGTGYHETTRLSIRLMEKYLTPRMTLLDIGTGTGVLAIAGVKLGAGSAIGVDTDEWSYHNAQENIRANAVEDRVRVILGEISSVRDRTFDMIIANIQRSVLEPMLEEISSRLSTSGILILSGLVLPEREEMIHVLHRWRLGVVEELAENEWIALTATPSSIP